MPRLQPRFLVQGAGLAGLAGPEAADTVTSLFNGTCEGA